VVSYAEDGGGGGGGGSSDEFSMREKKKARDHTCNFRNDGIAI